MANSNTKTITIEKPYGGWISASFLPGTGSDLIQSTLEGNPGQYAYSVAVSLYRSGRRGHLSPGEVFTTVGDSSSYVTALALNGSVASSGNSFIVLRDGRVVRTATDGLSVTDYQIPVAHGGYTLAVTSNFDVITLKDPASGSNEYVVSTWADDGFGDVMIFKVASNGNMTNKRTDWFSQGASASYLVAAVPLKLTQGPDGNIYGTNGQHLLSASMASGVSIANATKTAQSLNLGSGWISSGICNYKNFVCAVGYQASLTTSTLARSTCRVWLWDGFSPEPNFIFDIPDNYANGIFYDGKDLYAFTNGRNGTSKLWIFNGSAFDLKFETPAIATSATPSQGSLEWYDNSLIIASDKSHIYQWDGGLHNRTIVTDGTNGAKQVGMCKNLYQAELFVGGEFPTAYTIVYAVNANYYVNADFRTRLLDKWDDGTAIRKPRIKAHHYWFSQRGTGASMITSVFNNFYAIAVSGANDLLNLTLTNNTVLTDYIKVERQVDPSGPFYMNFRWNHASTGNTAFILQKYVAEGEELDIT